MPQLNTSEYIHNFNVFVKSILSEYNYYFELVNKCDKATNDYLHQIELGERKDRNKTATALARCRRQRREAKDKLAILQPIKDWIDKSQAALGALNTTLGNVRAKEKVSPRYYYPRIIEDLPIANK